MFLRPHASAGSRLWSRSTARWIAAPMAVIVAAATLTSATVVATIAAAPPAVAQPPAGIADTPTGDVLAMDVVDGVSYLGGEFTGVGANTGGGAAVDPITGVVDRSWPGVSGSVEAVVDDGSGGYFIGGTFSAVGGAPRMNLAHILSDGTVDPQWRPRVDGRVTTVARAGSTVYVGGRFTHVNGTSERGNAAAFDSSSGVLKDWNPNLDDEVLSIAASATTVYLGGWFSFINGVVARAGVAAVDATSGLVTEWNPQTDGVVRRVRVHGSTVYLIGSFASVNNGVARGGVAAVDGVTGVANDWDPQLFRTLANTNVTTPGSVQDLDFAGNTVYLVGEFDLVNTSVPRNNAAAFDSATAQVTAWNPDVGPNVSSLSVLGSSVYLAGDFTTVNSTTPRRNAAAVDAMTGTVLGWDPRPNAAVWAIDSNDSTVFLGGGISHVNVVDRNRAAAIDATGRVTDWHPNADDDVKALKVVGSTIYLGGDFTTVDGTVRHRAASVSKATGSATTWDPDLNGAVNALSFSQDTVYLGGDFTSVNGGIARNRVAAVNATTGVATAWNPNASAEVNALAVSGTTVFIGGWFSTINGVVPRQGVAAVDALTAAASNWDPQLNGAVRALGIQGNALYLGGTFTRVNGNVTRRHAAAVDTTSGSLTSWNPDLLAGGFNSIAFDRDTVYLGGDFTYVNGSRIRRYAAAVDATTGQANNWSPELNRPVRALSVTPEYVYLAGLFTDATNGSQARPASFFARVTQVNDTATQFVPLAPTRVVDTRIDPGKPVNAPRYVLVDLSDLVPRGTSAVSFNVTATGQTSSGYLNVAPEGMLPGSSTINWSRGNETIANGHVVSLSETGRLVIQVEGAGSTHIVLDITGFFAPAGTPNATLYSPANRRILDSRNAGGPLQPGATRTVNINTGGSAQAVAPTAASVNVTVTGTTGTGVLTAAKEVSAATSTINWSGPGQTVANAVITDVAANGDFTLTNNGKTATHVIVDLTGTFAPTADGATGGQFYARHPDRTYDSRFDPAGRLQAGQSRTTTSPLPAEAVAIVVNSTVTDTQGTGYLSVTPPASGVPTTSTINWFTSPTTRANGSIIASDDTANRAYVGGNYSTHYLYDLAGYFR